MAGLDSRHVTWGHLQYYDTQIKKFVEDAVATLEKSTVTPEETAAITKKLNEVEQLATVNRANIEAIVAVNKDQEARITTLFTYNTTTKEDLATQTARIDSIKEDLLRLEESLKHDHKTIEDIRIVLENKADKSYVEDAIKNIPQISLANYFTKDEVLQLIPNVGHLATKEELAKVDGKINTALDDIKELENKTETDHKTIEEIQLTLTGSYYTKDEVEDLLPDTSAFVTTPELEAAIDNCATEAEVTSLIQEIADVQEQLDEKANIEDIPSIQGLATEEFVVKKIAEAELADQDVDLSAYYTKSETEAVVKAAVDAINVPDVSNLATKEELEAVQNVAGSNSVKLFAIESDLVDINAKLDTIPSTEGLATETYVDEKFAEIVIPDVSEFATKGDLEEAINNIEYPTVDLSDYYTKSEVDEAIANVEHPTVDLEGYAKLTDIPDVSNFATKDEVAAVEAKVDAIVIPEVPTKVSEFENDAGYLTEHQDISGKADKSDLVGLATESYVNAAIENIPEVDLSDYATQQFVLDKIAEVPTDYLKEVPSEYITESELSEELAKIEHPTVDLDGYATEAWVNEQGFLKEHQDLSDYAKKSELPTDYLTASDIENKADKDELTSLATKQEVASVEEKIPDVSNFATKDEVPSIEGLASTDYVDQAIANIPETDVSNLATKDELEAVEAKIPTNYLTSIPEEYITKQELDSEGFVKSLDGYATEQFVTDAISNIKHPDPDLSNYYTKGETDSAINEAIEGIKIPEVDLTPYATKVQVDEQVAAKADNVPFTTDMFVTKPQGGFTSGDNLNGLSIATILSKLLGLQATPAPDEPDIPDEPTTIVDKIIKNQLGMYQVNEAAEVVEIPYNYVTYDNTSYDAAPDANYFYQKLDDNGEVIESGYQHVSDENDSMYYLIALPQGVNFHENVSVKVWDETSNTWADVTDSFEMSSDLQFIEDALVEAELSMPTIPEGYTLWIESSLNTCTGSDYRFIINE